MWVTLSGVCESEFGGLGLTMAHTLFVSPLILVAPALLRIPSDRKSKHAVIRHQYLIYALLAASGVLLSLEYCFAGIAVTTVNTEAASNHSHANLTPRLLGYAHPTNSQKRAINHP